MVGEYWCEFGTSGRAVVVPPICRALLASRCGKLLKIGEGTSLLLAALQKEERTLTKTRDFLGQQHMCGPAP